MAAHQRVTRSSFQFARTATSTLGVARDRSSAASAEAVSSRFWPTLLLVALCQLSDLITFNFAVETFGPSGELGPLGMVYRIGGFWAVAIVKLSLIGVVMTVLARYPWQRLATRRRVALIVAAIGVAGAFTNSLAFVWLR